MCIRDSIYNDLGRIEMARLEMERTLPRFLRWGEVQIIVPHLEQLARAYAALGAEAEAGQTIQHFLDLIDRSPYLDWSCTMAVIFACSWYTTRPETLAAAHACLPRLERAHSQFHTLESEAALAEGQGIIALAEGASPTATHHFRQAAAAWEALGRPYDQARALKSLGSALHAWHTQHPHCLLYTSLSSKKSARKGAKGQRRKEEKRSHAKTQSTPSFRTFLKLGVLCVFA